MPSASSTLFFFASFLGVQARVIPDACPAACSDISAYGIEHHRLQELSHCAKKVHYDEVFNLNSGELVPEISICSDGDASPIEEKRNVNKPTEHLVDFHISSKTSGQALVPWEVEHLSQSMADRGKDIDLPAGSPYWVTVHIQPGSNVSMGLYAGADVEPASLGEAIRGWGKQFVNGTSTFAAQWCGMGKRKSIGFVFDGQGLDKGVVREHMNTWDQDKCVMDFDNAHVWEDVPVTYKNDVWQAVERPGY